jgi:hypothetical protein
MSWFLCMVVPPPPSYGTPLWFWDVHAPLRPLPAYARFERGEFVGWGFAGYRYASWATPLPTQIVRAIKRERSQR